MSLRQFVVTALALLGGAYAASSCCFVVQDQAHEAFWPAYATETLTVAVNLTAITTLLTAYPTTTITNLETNIYPTTRVVTQSQLVNPVALYTNPGNAIPQKTEMLVGPEPVVTGGSTLNSPTGFWVYPTVQVFAAPAVTDANGNVACGTLSSFSSAPTDPPACVATFSGINANAAATFVNNAGQGVQITLTAPYIHIPTRPGLQINPTEACAQGNGTENYGYPPQELINHLAGNAFYSAQFPGIENCLPAGPTIQAVEALALAVPSGDTAAAAAASSTSGNGGVTETAGGGGLTSSTTVIVTGSGTTTSSTSSSSAAAATSSSTTSATSTSTPTALQDTTSSTNSGGVTETVVSSGGLLPTTPTSSTSSTSQSTITPLLETTPAASSQTSTASSSTLTPISSASSSSPTSISSASSPSPTSISSASSSSPTSISSASSSSPTSISSASQASLSGAAASSSTLSLSTSFTEPSTAELVIQSSELVPVSDLPGFTGPETTISSSTFFIISGPTTIPLVILGPTSTGSTASGPPPVTSSSMKDFVPWKLLVALTGLAALGPW